MLGLLGGMTTGQGSSISGGAAAPSEAKTDASSGHFTVGQRGVSSRDLVYMAVGLGLMAVLWKKVSK